MAAKNAKKELLCVLGIFFFAFILQHLILFFISFRSKKRRLV